MFINIIISLTAIGMILSTGSVYLNFYGRDFFPIITIFLMSFLVFWRFIIVDTNRQKIGHSGFIGIFLIVMIPFLIDFLNYIQSFQITFFHIVVVMLSFFIGKQNREKILEAYLPIMVFISFVSLLYFFVNLIFWRSGGVTQFISPLYIEEELKILVFPLWSIFESGFWNFPRNMSIFTEPGSFGFHIIICIMLAFKEKRFKSLIVLISAALTTFSTSMYICLFFIFLYAIFYRGFLIIKPKYVVLILALFIFIFSRLQIEGMNWNFIQLVKGTIAEKFNPKSSAYTSTAGRISYSLASFDMFLDNIFLGKGHYSSNTSLDFSKMEGAATNTSSLFGLPAELGLFGIFCIFLYLRFFHIFKLFTVPITFLWLNAEYMPYSILMLFILSYQGEEFFKKLKITSKGNHLKSQGDDILADTT